MSGVKDNRSKLLDEFCQVTGVEQAKAGFFLESAGWDYNLAVSTFYEDASDGVSTLSEAFSGDESLDTSEVLTEELSPEQPKKRSRIVTMSSLMQNDERENEEGQAFYAGGSTRSGQQVLGPSKTFGPNIVKEMFKAAKSHGAEIVNPDSAKCNPAGLRVFRGAGQVLGGSSNASDDCVGIQRQRLDVTVRAYSNGFTVDNGSLREYADPCNNEFLSAIHRGEIPQELIDKAGGGEINLNLEDHRYEEYVTPKQTLQAFSGQGHRLGSPSPPVSDHSSGSSAYKSEEEAEKLLNVNQDLPLTTIQVRLADGSRLLVKLNHNHTIGDIRQYIVLVRPEYSARVFSLRTVYPPAELTNDRATVKDSNLFNAVIVQKL